MRSLLTKTLRGLGAALVGALLYSSAAAATVVRGKVLTDQGQPVEEAQVEANGGGVAVFTDKLGCFTLSEVSLPDVLVISHPHFQEATVKLEASGTQEIEVRLLPKHVLYERLFVSADGQGDRFPVGTIAASSVDPADGALPPSTLTESLIHLPGVAENGQGGLFQVISIRGLSRQRVLNLVSGMRVTSERRAGVATSFVDPLLIGEVEVLRGPASVYYGSGALGGATHVAPRSFDRSWLEVGYDSQGDETFQALGWGGRGWSLGLVRRGAGDGEAADGTRLNSRFEQLSASLQKSWGSGERSYKLLLLPSYGEDIGKANTDFPERSTRYPRERHLMVKFAASSGRGWQAQGFLHPHSLETEVVTAGVSREDVSSETVDFGARWERTLSLGRKLAGRVGVDYFGRRGVEVDELAHELESGTSQQFTTLDDGEEDQAAAFAMVDWTWGPARLEAGSRLTWIRQSNRGEPSADDSALVGFVGAAIPLRSNLELVAHLGTGNRFPSLSERFFVGTTGRGQVIGNPRLGDERALNAELGLHWLGDRVFLAGSLFRNRVDDYIDRIELDTDVLTFVNRTRGTIEGVELEGSLQLDLRWRLLWGGHRLLGRDSEDQPLADIPPDELRLGLRFQPRRWQVGAEVRWRNDKDDPGNGEKELASALLLATALRYDVGRGIELYLTSSNLLDETYFSAADRKAPVAPGRSVGLGVRWEAR